ncbi:MAG TPA: tRNA pseudouridine(55) synthase TruB, partial [Nitrospirota bacterium]
HFTITCSKGVYIRTLCSEMGDALGMGAHLANLVRTRSGRFSISQAMTLDRLADLAAAGAAEQALTSIDEALAEFPSVPVSEAETIRILHGNHIPCPQLSADGGGLVRLHSPAGRLLALARIVSGTMQPDIVFS